MSVHDEQDDRDENIVRGGEGNDKPTPEQVRVGIMQNGLRGSETVIRQCCAQIDQHDMHFAKRPADAGPANDGELMLVILRRQAVTVLRAIRDSADAALQAGEEGPAAAAFQRRFGPLPSEQTDRVSSVLRAP